MTRIAGVVLTAIVTLMLLADAAVDLFAPHKMDAEMAATGFPPALTPLIGAVCLVCAILYAIPRTRVLGAILVTGFLGGAISTHVRLGEIGSPPEIVSLVLGVLAWTGLYLQDSRVRALLPLTTR